ncbi:MAG TPA: TerC family protein [Candidatus Limnocylindrales bacterium]|nr:TerC family protein [Candidatus Limnocylindrales bacterium]
MQTPAMELLSNPATWTALVTLTALEIVLGVDNVVFISVLTQKLPAAQRDRARTLGLGLAMGTRILLLLTLAAIAALTTPLFTLLGHGFSGRDIVLIAGGLFLLAKSTVEIHESLEGADEAAEGASAVARRRQAAFGSVIVQILLLDIVFSLDSVITAVGMANDVPVMVAAIVIAVLVMLVASGPIARFVGRHPTVKMLALSFLLLIGMSLVADGFGLHIPKEYLYFAMGFSVFVEMLNLRIRGRPEEPSEPVHLRPTSGEEV